MIALAFPLHEQRPTWPAVAAHRLRSAAQRPVTREQREDSAVGCMCQLDEDARDGRAMPRLIVVRLGHVGRNAEETLRPEVERRRQHLSHRNARRLQREYDSLFVNYELSAHEGRRASQ